MKVIHVVAFILLVIGGLNWGLVGLFEYDLVYKLLGRVDYTLVRAVYALVGVAAVVELATHPKNCRMCKSSGSQTM
ncbi:MAG: DUF378 domain-containing protein [Candidatus Ryanbacteria bacterium]|nr:DUF378 domain-containing protein [Candidatus Ryanbacteria bacterium]